MEKMETNNYYKTLTDQLQSREKKLRDLRNETIQLREEVASLTVQLQDLVHPKKWTILAEVKELIKKEMENLYELDNYLNNFCSSLILNLNTNAALGVNLDVKSIIEQVDELLNANQVD